MPFTVATTPGEFGRWHALVVANTVQPYLGAPTVNTFQDWTWTGGGPGGSDPSPEIWVNASALTTSYIANFSATEALTTVVSNICGPMVCGGVPGTIKMGGSTITGTVAVPFGSTQVLTADPTLDSDGNPKFAFVSWSPGVLSEDDNADPDKWGQIVLYPSSRPALSNASAHT